MAPVFIGADWAIVKIDNSDPNTTYSTVITKKEHDDLLRLLGLKKQ
jgi:hypothetical protein